MTSNSKAEGRLRQARLPLGAEEDIYIPAGERLAYLYTNRGKWISPAPLRRRGADGSQNAPDRPWPHGVYKDAVDYSVFSGGWDAVETRGDPKDFAARWAAYVALYDSNVVIHEAPSLPYGGDYSGDDAVARHAQGFGGAWEGLQSTDDRRLERVNRHQQRADMRLLMIVLGCALPFEVGMY